MLAARSSPRVAAAAWLLLFAGAAAQRPFADLSCGADGAETLDFRNVVHNNLAGRGPDGGFPHSVQYSGVATVDGKCILMEVSAVNEHGYQPESAAQNGVTMQSTEVGKVNLLAGTQADLKINFLECETKEPALVTRFNISFYAVNEPTSRRITVRGYSDHQLQNPALFTKEYTDIGTTYTAAEPCQEAVGSEACALTFSFSGVSELEVTLEAPKMGHSIGEPFYFGGAICKNADVPYPSRCSAQDCPMGFVLQRGVEGSKVCEGGSCTQAECCAQSYQVCSQDVCGYGFAMKPAKELPVICDGQVCTQEECCAMASEELARIDQLAQEYPHIASCHGHERQWHTCDDLPECHPCIPQDCEFGQWQEWKAVGGCSGLAERKRTTDQTNNACGSPCTGPTEETVSRIDDKKYYPVECQQRDQDCQWAEWSQWTECHEECTPCMRGQSFRSRSVFVRQQGHGVPCAGAWNETRPCQLSDAQDCEMSQWAEWTECSQSCGTGWKERMRRVIKEPLYGGKPCGMEGDFGEGEVTREMSPCGVEPCGTPAPCVPDTWTTWSKCVLGQGWQKYRSRSILQPSTHGAGHCDYVLNETEGCPHPEPEQPEACKFSSWSEWGDCSATCAGQTVRTRSVSPSNCTLNEASRGNILRETMPCGSQTCWNAACKLSKWTAWSNCSSECGTGVATRSRKVLHVGDSKGCNAALTEAKACLENECHAINCKWGEWAHWSGCTSTCGGGTKRRNRVITVAPRNGGKLCRPEAKSEVAPCATQSCDVCIDGAWGQWSKWGECSAKCGPAFRVRHRDVEKHANSCGKPALGVEDEYKVCDLSPCEEEKDCEVSAWNEWSACTNKCYGVQEKHRSIAQFAAGHGKPCHNESLKEVRQCHPLVGEDPPHGCGPDPERACKIGAWEEWSKCSATCDGGQRSRARIILSPNANDGPPCEDDLAQVEPCHTHSCAKGACKDCELDEWSEWGDCTTKCGGQRFRHREVKQLENHCGKPCNASAVKETDLCPACTEKYFCGWSRWQEMGECSSRCGYATYSRQRQLTLSTENQGARTFFEAVDQNSPCSGNQIDVKICPYKPCENEHMPRDCKFNAWEEWSEPGCDQMCTRKRTIADESEYGGRPCAGPEVETKRCEKDCSAPEDCEWDAWQAWHPKECSDENDQRIRIRKVAREAQNGGTPCAGVVKETASCALGEQKVRSCELAFWSMWTECTRTCGGGLRTRSREIENPAAGGGEPCTDALEEMEKCNAQMCIEDRQDCLLGKWGSWTPCDGEDMKYRLRSIEQEPTALGMPCQAALKEVEQCSRVVHCRVTSWTTWDMCDRTCGGGQQTRQRAVVQNPLNGGDPCPTDLIEVAGCNEGPCSEQDCTVAEWTDWSVCSAECGRGFQERSRDYHRRPCEGGLGCNVALKDAKPCEMEACECVDCKWGQWGMWSHCSQKCGGGQRSRERHIIQAPKPGCKPCEARDKEEIEACNFHTCHEKVCVNGQWDEWLDWEPCSATCEGGETWRMRRVKVEANDCGVPAVGLSTEHKKCNAGVGCTPAIDCQFTSWQDWTPCSARCEGIKRRSREVKVHGQGEGKFCVGSLEETWPCELESGTLDFSEPTMYLDLSQLETNNFGGAGPGDAGNSLTAGDDTPPVMRFKNVAELPEPGRTVDLIIEPKGAYMPCEVQANGKQGHTFAAINLPSGSRIDVQLQLVDSKTGEPIPAKELVVKIFDLDGGAAQSSLERVHAKDFDDYFLTSDSSVKVSKELSGLTVFEASSYGTDDDNPLDPTATMPAQERKAVAFLYTGESKIDLSLEVTDGEFCKTFLFAVRGCFGGSCRANPCSEEQHEAVDCQLTAWGNWGECDATCGIGQKIRSREVITEPAFGGKACSAALSQTLACELRSCRDDCTPVDCSWEEWGGWGACDKCSGEMRRFRHISSHPSCGGRRCEFGSAEEITNCTRTCHADTFCMWSQWGDYGECSASCGQGLRSRARYLKAMTASTLLAEQRARSDASDASQQVELLGKFEQLSLRSHHIKMNRIQVLLLSFTGGCLSLFAAMAAIRNCALRPAEGRSARSRAHVDIFRSHGYIAAPTYASGEFGAGMRTVGEA